MGLDAFGVFAPNGKQQMNKNSRIYYWKDFMLSDELPEEDEI